VATSRSPVRVGLVIGQLTTGGAEGQLWMLCRGLDRSVVSPFVYCLSPQVEPYKSHLEASDVPVRVIRGGRWERVRGLRRWLESDGVELVHAWLFIANAYAWLAGRGGRRALVTSARNCKRQGRLLDLLNRKAFAASDAVIVNSLQVKRYVQEQYSAPPERTTVVYNAIDTERFRPGPPRERAEVHVGMVGRLVAQKNPLLFVEAAARVRRQVPEARFLLVGDGPLRRDVQEAVRAAGLEESVRLAGERDDVAELLRGLDLFWLTSDWEGLPNAILEAMASGLPVVATDVGGVSELVTTGRNGFVVGAGDAEAMASRSIDLLRDRPKLRSFALAARARAQDFAPEQMVSSTLAVYRRASGRAS
jgi:glycosyltransferase involved in cell wall biosynthesis